jgi:hypothetical protein
MADGEYSALSRQCRCASTHRVIRYTVFFEHHFNQERVNMKRTNKLLISGFALLGVALSSTASADGVVFLPVTKDGYKPEAAVSLLAGTMKPSQSGTDSSTITGAELSFRCILLQVGDNQLRQQLSYTTWKKNNLTLQNVELNAHYQLAVANDFKIGVGPGLGLIITDLAASDNPTFYGVQFGVSAHYTGLRPLFIGAEARYQFTNKDEFVSGAGKDDMNNSRVAVKLGYMF